MRARAQPVESSRCKNGASCDKMTTVKQSLSDVRRALGRGGAGDPLKIREVRSELSWQSGPSLPCCRGSSRQRPRQRAVRREGVEADVHAPLARAVEDRSGA